MDRYTNLVENPSDNNTNNNKITDLSFNSNNTNINNSPSNSNKKINNGFDSILTIDENEKNISKEKKFFRERCLEILQMELNNQENNEIKEEIYKEEEIVYCRNIHKTYLIGMEGVPALRGVSLKVRKGEFLIILGTSGGGKINFIKNFIKKFI